MNLLLALGCAKSREEGDNAAASNAQAQISDQMAVAEPVVGTVSYRTSLAELKLKRDKLCLAASRLEDAKNAVVGCLTHNGKLTLMEEVKQDATWIDQARELKHLVEDLRRLRRQIVDYDVAIARLESYLRGIEQQELTADLLTQEDRNRLSEIVRDLNDKMSAGAQENPGQDLDLEAVVEKEVMQDNRRHFTRSETDTGK
jgi:hypothetical protein